MNRHSVPIFLAAMMLVVLSGCASTAVDTGMTGESSSSADAMMGNDDAMMDSGMSSSAGAMMDSGTQASVQAGTSAYVDGTYDATGTYTSPAGAEEVKVTLTLSDGVVTDAQFTGMAENPVSKKRQQDFSDGYAEMVVGKSIDAVSLTKVNGSSLTPKGFMEAVAQIKAEAKAS